MNNFINKYPYSIVLAFLIPFLCVLFYSMVIEPLTLQITHNTPFMNSSKYRDANAKWSSLPDCYDQGGYPMAIDGYFEWHMTPEQAKKVTYDGPRPVYSEAVIYHAELELAKSVARVCATKDAFTGYNDPRPELSDFMDKDYVGNFTLHPTFDYEEMGNAIKIDLIRSQTGQMTIDNVVVTEVVTIAPFIYPEKP